MEGNLENMYMYSETCLNNNSENVTNNNQVQSNSADIEVEGNNSLKSSCVTAIFTRESIIKLLQLVNSNKKRLHDKTTKKWKIWQEICDEIQSVLPGVTRKQVKKKWQNLLTRYKRYVIHSKEDRRCHLKQPEFFEEIDNIVGKVEDFHRRPITLHLTDLPTTSVSQMLNAGPTIIGNKTQSAIFPRPIAPRPVINVPIKNLAVADFSEDDSQSEDAYMSARPKKRRRMKLPTRSELIQESLNCLIRTIEDVRADQLSEIESQKHYRASIEAEFKRKNNLFEEFVGLFRQYVESKKS